MSAKSTHSSTFVDWLDNHLADHPSNEVVPRDEWTVAARSWTDGLEDWLADREVPVMGAVSSKPSNPKDALGSDRVPLHLWPMTATVYGSMALLEGMLKYGRLNWRKVGVRSSIYYDALQRHMGRWFEGEDTDPDSGLPHLAKALACVAILIDAEAAGQLTDDRQFPGGLEHTLAEMTPHVTRLKAVYTSIQPKHYTREDQTKATI